MKTAFLVLHLLISLALASVILLQSGKGGLGSAFGSTGAYRSKRGAEKIVFSLTFILSFLFFITSVTNILVR